MSGPLPFACVPMDGLQSVVEQSLMSENWKLEVELYY